jgi:hypothetical protein
VSELQKRIQKVQRRETGARIGFGPVSKEQPRAMLLIARAADAAGAAAAVEAGADAVLVEADTDAAAKVIAEVGAKACPGALTGSLDEAGAAALRAAGCDFVISTLDGTAAAAVKTDEMGQVVEASGTLDEATLRALGPLGLDGLYVNAAGAMTLAQQLGLVRLASLSGAPLIVAVAAEATVEELRVLRDSGAAAIVAPGGATPAVLGELVTRLKAVPAPSKGKRKDEVALLPALLGRGEEEHDHEADDD